MLKKSFVGSQTTGSNVICAVNKPVSWDAPVHPVCSSLRSRGHLWTAGARGRQSWDLHLGLPDSKIYFCCEKGPSLSLPNTQMSCCFPRNGLCLTKAREGVSTEAGSMWLQSSLSSVAGEAVYELCLSQAWQPSHPRWVFSEKTRQAGTRTSHRAFVPRVQCFPVRSLHWL